MKNDFVIAEVMPGKLNAMVKNVMLQMRIDDPNEAVRRINSGEWIVKNRSWYEEHGIIYCDVTSDGTTGLAWIKRLEKKGFFMADSAKDLLRSAEFKPTSGVTTKITILKQNSFEGQDCILEKDIRVLAASKGFTKPNAEVTCLIREKFSDEDIQAMDLKWIVIMHEQIKDPFGKLTLFNVHNNSKRHIGAYNVNPESKLRTEKQGFAFESSSILY